MNAQVESIPEVKTKTGNKPKKNSHPKQKFVKPARYSIDTSTAVIVHGDSKFVYDQIKIVSKFSKEVELKISDFVIDMTVEPADAVQIIDNAILRVVLYNKKYHIVSGKNKFRAAVAENQTTIKAHCISPSVLNRTLQPPKPLTKEELETRLANSGLKLVKHSKDNSQKKLNTKPHQDKIVEHLGSNNNFGVIFQQKK